MGLKNVLQIYWKMNLTFEITFESIYNRPMYTRKQENKNIYNPKLL